MQTSALKKHESSAEVEAASGGKQVVLRTIKGQPTYMNVIPAFNCEDLGPGFGTGLHPAFLVGGVAKREIYIGTYQAVIVDGEAVSLPGQDPAVSIDFGQARSACLAAGPGFHLMTNWEWAGLALWCIKNGFGQLRGNTDYGKSHLCSDEAGIISKQGRTLTGSGPDAWRHDGTPFGIADLVGNVWEWNDGLKLVEGRVLMPRDNNFNLLEEAWPDTGVRIDTADGIEISDTITDPDYTSADFAEATVKEGYEPPVSLKQALLCAVAGQDVSGRFWADSTEEFEALPIRGGCWGGGSDAGLAALNLNCERSIAGSFLGFRPAFIE